MKDRKFCCHGAHICSLTKKEIENPGSTLAEIFQRRNLENFQNDLWILQKTIYRDGEWKNYDPADIFSFGNDLIRLVEILWLINKYSPQLSSTVVSPMAPEDLMQNINLLFNSAILKTTDEANYNDSVKTVLGQYFKRHHSGSKKLSIYNYLQAALDASYMRNDKHEFFSIDEEASSTFSSLSELITEGYKIHKKGIHVFPNLEACKETKLSIDKDHPTFLSYECIVAPSDLAENFFLYYLNIDYIKSGLHSWKKLLYAKDFWKAANNPGNLIYLQICLSKLVDVIWLMYRKEDIERYLNSYTIAMKNIAQCTDLSSEELSNPLLVIKDFFGFKKLHQWKNTLNKWLMYSLSNSQQPASKNLGKTELGFRQLVKFIEATYLLICTKNQTEQTC